MHENQSLHFNLSFNDPNINEQGFPIILENGKFVFIRVLQSDVKGSVCLYNSLLGKNFNSDYPY